MVSDSYPNSQHPVGLFEGQGEPGWRPGPGQSEDGRDFIAGMLVERGWTPHGARRWAGELLHRYPALCHDDYRGAAEVADRLYATVADPRDWDSVGAVLNILEWRWATQ